MPSFSLTPMQPFPPPGSDDLGGTQFQDEGDNVGPPTPAYVNFTGSGVTATYDEDTETVTVDVSGLVSGLGSPTLQVQEDDVDVGAADTETLNFEGDVSVTDDGTGKRTVTINSGGALLPLDVSQNDVVVVEDVTLINIEGDAPLVTAGTGGVANVSLRNGVRSVLLTGAQLFPSLPNSTDWYDVLMGLPGSGYTIEVTDWGNLPDDFWPTWHDDYNYWSGLNTYPWYVAWSIRGTWLSGTGSLHNTQFRGFTTATPQTQNPVLVPVAGHQRLYEGEPFQIGFSGIVPPTANALKLQILNPASGDTIQIDDVRITFAPMAFSAGTEGAWP